MVAHPISQPELANGQSQSQNAPENNVLSQLIKYTNMGKREVRN
jgi:hypothetical protein